MLNHPNISSIHAITSPHSCSTFTILCWLLPVPRGGGGDGGWFLSSSESSSSGRRMRLAQEIKRARQIGAGVPLYPGNKTVEVELMAAVLEQSEFKLSRVPQAHWLVWGERKFQGDLQLDETSAVVSQADCASRLGSLQHWCLATLEVEGCVDSAAIQHLELDKDCCHVVAAHVVFVTEY